MTLFRGLLVPRNRSILQVTRDYNRHHLRPWHKPHFKVQRCWLYKKKQNKPKASFQGRGSALHRGPPQQDSSGGPVTSFFYGTPKQVHPATCEPPCKCTVQRQRLAGSLSLSFDHFRSALHFSAPVQCTTSLLKQVSKSRGHQMATSTLVSQQGFGKEGIMGSGEIV